MSIYKIPQKSIFTILIFICTIRPILSQSSFHKEFGIISDNDVYTSTYFDRYYTNGTFLYFKYLSKTSSTKRIHKFELGQKIYTPQFSNSNFIEAIDRPYAGYSFIKYSYSIFSDKNFALKPSIELGVLGPNSKAKETQVIIHQIYGFRSTFGWEYQIQNAIGVNIGCVFTKPFATTKKKHVDFTSVTSFNIGTILTEFTTSIYGRYNLLRSNLNKYNNTILFESNLNNEIDKQKNELFIFLKPQIGYSLYNATIQGSLFSDNSPVTFPIKPFIFEIELGLKYSIHRFDLSYSIIKHSKKIASIKTNTINYGSIKIAYKFN